MYNGLCMIDLQVSFRKYTTVAGQNVKTDLFLAIVPSSH